MKHKLYAPLITVLTCLASCTSIDDSQVVNVRLTASPQNAGQIGQATLAAAGEDTSMSIFISGVPSETTRPVHIYTYIYTGTCERHPDTAPAYSMNDRVLVEKDDGKRGWTLSRRADVDLDTLRSGQYSIVLRTGPADGNREIFCGEIG
ncbi:hypothetical protein E8E95_00880 [Pseudomonas sp. BN414]|uniref:hypothetical protein n=1 Tax=Pseudomonas sp. BN414 TaxID=2567888 RepID=UPI002453B825|nr:hypothetical protein [Pseudomonas sp. BN414]MDH4565240.1 hypothetical protein [Pseudomonas sp. BN414]